MNERLEVKDSSAYFSDPHSVAQNAKKTQIDRLPVPRDFGPWQERHEPFPTGEIVRGGRVPRANTSMKCVAVTTNSVWGSWTEKRLRGCRTNPHGES
jgi:hypothetical protein